MKGLLGKKLGMAQVFDAESGEMAAVTVLEVGPCMVVKLKTTERDGYDAVQLGFGSLPEKAGQPPAEAEGKKRRKRGRGKLSRSQASYFKTAGCSPRKHLKEVRLAEGDAPGGLKVGTDLTVGEVFKGVLRVDVAGLSKGKGFQGVIKRWHFAGGAGSHGSMFHRAPGSIGQSSYPSRVFPGMKMPGRMGGGRVTARNLRVVEIDAEHNLMIVQGAVPGAKGGLVIVSKSNGKGK